MSRLSDLQARFLAALHGGPVALERDDFATMGDRHLLAMKAHANTVSHARVAALEDSFPRLRAAMGTGAFHVLARVFVQTDAAHAAPLARIGASFADWLESRVGDVSLVDLARIEWAWLMAYHAADRQALLLSDLAGMMPAHLLSFPIRLHPAAQLVALSGPLHAELGELAVHREAAALLVTRPEAEVCLSPLDAASVSIVRRASDGASLGDLFDVADALREEAGPETLILPLIGAGAFITAL